MLGTPKVRINRTAFALWWVAGLVIVRLTVLIAAIGSNDPDRGSATTVNWIKPALGVAFLVTPAKQRQICRRNGTEPTPQWMATVDGSALAAASIAQAGLSSGRSAVAAAPCSSSSGR